MATAGVKGLNHRISVLSAVTVIGRVAVCVVRD